MTLWETEEMEEAARNRQWEELNTFVEPKLDVDEVDGNLLDALEKVEAACKSIGEAFNLCKEFPALQNDVGYILDTLGDMRVDIEKFRNDIAKEVKSA